MQAPLLELPGRNFGETGHLYNLAGADSCESPPGPDDPSEPTRLGLRGLSRQLIAPAVPTPTAVPLRLLRPRARGSMCRELHERFMPDRNLSGNDLNHRSITFIIHRVIHSVRRFECPANRGVPCLSAQIAAKIAGSSPGVWTTNAFDMWTIGNQVHLKMRIELADTRLARRGFFTRSSPPLGLRRTSSSLTTHTPIHVHGSFGTRASPPRHMAMTQREAFRLLEPKTLV